MEKTKKPQPLGRLSTKIPIRSRREVVSMKSKSKFKRTWVELAADWLAEAFGTIAFLAFNVAVFVVWILGNLGIIKTMPQIDPYPFALLTMIVSLEAIFLSIIVLISQNRAAKIEEVRQEIDLQVNTISEQEITKIMEMLATIMKHQNIDISQDAVLADMLRPTNLEEIKRDLEGQL